MLKPGDMMPYFSGQAVMPNGKIEPISLAEYRNQWLVVFFWPLDFTFVCPTEIRGFNQLAGEFQMRGCSLLGASVDFTDIDPIKALIWSAVLNGVIAVPIMALMMRMAVRSDIMGAFTITPRLQRLGWVATALMAIAVTAMLASFVV